MNKQTAQAIFDKAFSVPRDKRSDEYKTGVLNILELKLKEKPQRPCPYPNGTAQQDAFFYGCMEGHRLAREYFESLRNGHD